MKILVSWSSGKDSAWTLHALRQQHGDAVAGLLTTTNEAFDRVAMHAVRRALLDAQARATGLPLNVVPLPWPCSNEIYEQAMGQALRAAIADGVTHIAFGDLFLEDVRAYRIRQLEGSGLQPIFPIWGEPTPELARRMVDAGLEAIVTCVDPKQLPAEFVGRRFDHAFLDALPDGVDPCGENGEFHTCVTAGPMWPGRIDLTVGERVERDGFCYADLMPAAS